VAEHMAKPDQNEQLYFRSLHLQAVPSIFLGPDCGWTATGKASKSSIRPAGEPMSVHSRKQSGHNQARKIGFPPGNIIV
jgi:hypothetical protein